MKALILTCSTGGGHHAGAAALSEALAEHGIPSVIKDCLDLISPAKAKLISEGHILLYRRAPKLFGAGYRFEEQHTPHFIRSQCEDCADALQAYLQQEACTMVISVHVFSALIFTAAKEKYRLSLPGYFVATDYTCSPGVSMTKQDAYFIPHADLRNEFIACGVPEERLVATGIPVSPQFCRTRRREDARVALGLPTGGRMVLLTCGSMGAGPMEELTVLLDQELQEGDHLAVICGTNEKLREKLLHHKLSPAVHITGFTNRMSLYMDAADVLLTKAGGLSSTEAVMKRLPLVYVDVIPGLEERNIHFMVSHGCAYTAHGPEGLCRLTCRLLDAPHLLQQCRDNMVRNFPTPAAEQICAYLCKETGCA